MVKKKAIQLLESSYESVEYCQERLNEYSITDLKNEWVLRNVVWIFNKHPDELVMPVHIQRALVDNPDTCNADLPYQCLTDSLARLEFILSSVKLHDL